MAQPQPYDRQFNFADQQAQTPSAPLPAQEVDAEFNAVKLTLDQTLANLAKVQRDDGALKNGIVTQDSLSPSLSIGFTMRGEWAAPVNYLVGDGVTYDSDKFYKALVSHLSVAGQTPETRPDLWLLVADFTAATADAQAAAVAAAASASAASGAASAATNSASAASGSASGAATSAGAAQGSADAAAASAAQAANLIGGTVTAAVRWDTSQTLTNPQQSQARDNIGFDAAVEGADFTPSLPATYTRPIGDKLKEARSILEWIDPAKHSDIRSATLSGDLNVALQAALDSGEPRILWPRGVYPVSLDGFSLVSALAGIQFVGEGAGRSILSNVSLASAARPLLISTGDNAVLRDLDIRPNTQGSSQPTMAGGQIAFGSGVLLMGDYARAENLRVSDTWDNCIGVGRYNLTTGAQTNAMPVGAAVANCVTFRGGSGTQTVHSGGAPAETPFNAGSGVNILCGSYVNVMNCADFYSTQGFIVDYAGGAFANLYGCYSYGARKSRVGSYANLDETPGGQGFYVGSRAYIRDCHVFDSEGDGLWMDGYSHDCDVSIHIKGAQQRAALIQGRDSRVSVQVEDVSLRGPGLYDAVTARGTAATGIDVFTHSTGMALDVRARSGMHRYGLGVEHSPYEFRGSLAPGAILTGVTAPVSNSRPDLFLVHEYTGGNGSRAQALGARTIAQSNTSYLVNAFGDFAGNGTLHLADLTTPQKRLAAGYDPVNDMSVLQSIHASVAPKPLALNPSGGAVIAGTGTWGIGPLRLGAHYLWVDGSGRLRIKSSAPTSDTDGTVVGTQA